MLRAAEIVTIWKAADLSLGIADDFRCVAMARQEEGISRDEYVAAAVAAGYKGSTAGVCWAYVKRQGQ